MRLKFGVNPVTLKELRQMVRSRLVAVGLMAFLFIQLVGVGFVLLTEVGSAEALDGGLYGKALGQGVFGVVFLLLSCIVLLCVPLFMGARMAIERGKEYLDLQFTTSLKPRQFVDGKIASAVVLILFFASAALPFLVLSYLLRGVDILRVFVAVAALLVMAVCVLYGILFLATVNMSRAFRLFILLGVVAVLLAAIGSINAACSGMVSTSSSLWRGAADELMGLGVVLFAIFSFCSLVRVFSVAVLSPAQSNRSVAVRVHVTALWIVWGGLAAIAMAVNRDSGYLYAWALVSVIASAVLLAVSVSMPEGHSRRVLADVSTHRFARLVQFVFFAGAESGMVWALLVGFLSVLVFLLQEGMAPGLSNDGDICGAQLVALDFYLAGVICSVRAAWYYILRRLIPERVVGVIAVFLVGLLSILPFLLTLDSGSASKVNASRWVGNIVAVFVNGSELGFHAGWASVCAAVAWVVCSPCIYGAFRRFWPPVLAEQQPEARAS